MNWRSRAGITAASVAALLCGSIGAGWAQDAPAVPARFGTHPTYDRLVLDWPSNAGYRVDQQGATATVVFDQAATLDEAQIRRDLARMAAGVTVTQSGGATTLTLQMADGVRLRHFRSGAKVVLDFSRSDAAPAGPPPPAPPAARAAPAPVAPSSTSASVSRPREQLPLPRTAPSSPVSPSPPATPPPPPAGAPAPRRSRGAGPSGVRATGTHGGRTCHACRIGAPFHRHGRRCCCGSDAVSGAGGRCRGPPR